MKEYLQENLGNILKEVELYEVYERYGRKFCKVVLRLIDGSSLRIWEKRKDGELEKYSYYWLDEMNNLIMGWDNAPHHKHVDSYPHHKHLGEEILPSHDNLETVVNILKLKLR